MNMRFLTIGMLVACVLVAAATSSRAQGSFIAAQASAGAKLYAQSSAQCHGATLQGGAGPTLTGSAFKQKYPTGSALYENIHKTMPLSAPGSLSASDTQNRAAEEWNARKVATPRRRWCTIARR
jgi:mono/diheme cytochrome c family protein